MVIGSFDVAYAHETNCPDQPTFSCYNSDNPKTNEIIHNLIDLGMGNVVNALASISSDSFSHILHSTPNELYTIVPILDVLTQSDFENVGCIESTTCDTDIVYGLIFDPLTIDKLSFEDKKDIWYNLNGESASEILFDEVFSKLPLVFLEEIYDILVPPTEPSENAIKYLQELIDAQNDIISQHQQEIDAYFELVTIQNTLTQQLQLEIDTQNNIILQQQDEYEIIKVILDDIFKLVVDYQ